VKKYSRGVEYELPTYCLRCGALLKAGATVHKSDCPVRKLIEEMVPNGRREVN